MGFGFRRGDEQGNKGQPAKAQTKAQKQAGARAWQVQTGKVNKSNKSLWK